MKLAHRLLRAYTGVLLGVGGYLARKLHHNFYLLLAGVFTVGVLLDVLFVHAIVDMRHRGYDLAVKNRIVVREQELLAGAQYYAQTQLVIVGEPVEHLLDGLVVEHQPLPGIGLGHDGLPPAQQALGTGAGRPGRGAELEPLEAARRVVPHRGDAGRAWRKRLTRRRAGEGGLADGNGGGVSTHFPGS